MRLLPQLPLSRGDNEGAHSWLITAKLLELNLPSVEHRGTVASMPTVSVLLPVTQFSEFALWAAASCVLWVRGRLEGSLEGDFPSPLQWPCFVSRVGSRGLLWCMVR